MTARCTSCGAAIIWCLTAAGRKTPVNAEPDRERGTIKQRGGYATILVGEELAHARAAGVTLYVSHWADCPQRRESRGKARP